MKVASCDGCEKLTDIARLRDDRCPDCRGTTAASLVAACDRVEAEIAAASVRADFLESLPPLTRLLMEDRPIKYYQAGGGAGLKWTVRYGSEGA